MSALVTAGITPILVTFIFTAIKYLKEVTYGRKDLFWLSPSWRRNDSDSWSSVARAVEIITGYIA